MQVQRQAQKDLQTGALNDETVNAYFQQHMQKVLESFWKINVTDIESTLKQVVAQVRASKSPVYEMPRLHVMTRQLYNPCQRPQADRLPLPLKAPRKLQPSDLLWPRAACVQVLSDPGLPERDMKARAKALKKLGSIFQVQSSKACVRQ